MAALQSLIEFYDDARSSNVQTPNQAEFRAYHLLVHIRDPEVARQIERLPPHIFDSPILQTALELRRFAQQNPAPRTKSNGPSQNYFSRFFSTVSRESIHFLMACLVQISFLDIRKAALKALKGAFRKANRSFPLSTLTDMLGCDDDEETTLLVAALGLQTETIENSGTVGVKLNPESSFSGRLYYFSLLQQSITEAPCRFWSSGASQVDETGRNETRGFVQRPDYQRGHTPRLPNTTCTAFVHRGSSPCRCEFIYAAPSSCFFSVIVDLTIWCYIHPQRSA